MLTRFSHLWFAGRLLPGLLVDRRQRLLLAEMRAFLAGLPGRMQSPLKGMAQIDQDWVGTTPAGLPPDTIRALADLTALLARHSPLGLCLRRSLLRYRYLRPAGLPLIVNFGAKLDQHNGKRQLTGHAWVELNGQPYYEASENWRGFQVMLRWPDPQTV